MIRSRSNVGGPFLSDGQYLFPFVLLSAASCCQFFTPSHFLAFSVLDLSFFRQRHTRSRNEGHMGALSLGSLVWWPSSPSSPERTSDVVNGSGGLFTSVRRDTEHHKAHLSFSASIYSILQSNSIPFPICTRSKDATRGSWPCYLEQGRY